MSQINVKHQHTWIKITFTGKNGTYGNVGLNLDNNLKLNIILSAERLKLLCEIYKQKHNVYIYNDSSIFMCLLSFPYQNCQCYPNW